MSQPFFRVELLAFSHRGAVPGGEAAGQPRPLPSARAKCELRGGRTSGLDPNTHTRPLDECRARGTAVIANGGVSNPSSRPNALCSPPPMRSSRGTGHASSGRLSNAVSGYRPFWGCRKGVDPACCTAPCHLLLRLGSVAAGSCCGAATVGFPLHRLSSAQRRSRVWEPRMSARPGRGCGSGAAGSSFRDLGVRGCSPASWRGPALLPPG